MDRKTAIQGAYKALGKEATFYDGMITCSTLVGKAICKVVWNMSQADNNRFIEAAVAGIPEQFCGVCHESISFFIRNVHYLTDMILVRHDTSAGLTLLLK